MEQLVKGVTLRRSGEFIEKVSLKGGDWSLLAAWDGTEVIRQDIRAGKRFGMYPQDGWNALEYIYIVEGEAVWEGNAQVVLGPGDSLAATPVGEPLILRAVTDVAAILVGSQPSFHAVSGQVQEWNRLAVSVEEKDGYTGDHCRRIRDLSVAVGDRLQLSSVERYNLYHGAFLHDLGKVAVPDAVLNKPGKLTAEEWVIMKQHPTTGSRMLEQTALATAARVVEQHHERLDGSGYPRGLRGDQICMEAQIVAVVDSFDAMTTDRVYRPALSRETAVAELTRNVGNLYNPRVVEAFLSVLDREEQKGSMA